MVGVIYVCRCICASGVSLTPPLLSPSEHQAAGSGHRSSRTYQPQEEFLPSLLLKDQDFYLTCHGGPPSLLFTSTARPFIFPASNSQLPCLPKLLHLKCQQCTLVCLMGWNGARAVWCTSASSSCSSFGSSLLASLRFRSQSLMTAGQGQGRWAAGTSTLNGWPLLLASSAKRNPRTICLRGTQEDSTSGDTHTGLCLVIQSVRELL